MSTRVDLTALLLYELLNAELRHGSHDQSSHGSWSVGNLDASPGVGLDGQGEADVLALDAGIGQGGTDLPDLAGANRADVEAAANANAPNVVAKIADDKAAAISGMTAKHEAQRAVRDAAKQRHAEKVVSDFGDLMESGDQRQVAAEFADKVDDALLDIKGQRVLDVDDNDLPEGVDPMGGEGGDSGGLTDETVGPDGRPWPEGGVSVGDDVALPGDDSVAPQGSSGPIGRVVPGTDEPSSTAATDDDLLNVVTSARNAENVKAADDGIQGVNFATLTDPASGDKRDIVARRNLTGGIGDRRGHDPATREYASGAVADALGARSATPGMALVNPTPDDPSRATVVQERFGDEFVQGAERGLPIRPAAANLRDLNTDDVKRIGALDYVTTNEDRHAKNFMVDDAGNVRGIDHGLSFSEADPAQGRFGTDRSAFVNTRSAREYMVNEVDWTSVSERIGGLMDDLEDGSLPATNPTRMMRRLEVARELADRAEVGEFHADGRWMGAQDFITNAASGA